MKTIRVIALLAGAVGILGSACIAQTDPNEVQPTAVGEASEAAQLRLREEQGKSLLLIVAPLLAYLVLWCPARFVRQRIRRRASPESA